MEELLQVFSSDKSMLNESIERSFKKTLTNGKHFMIVLIFIVNKGKYLIQKVSKEKGGCFAVTGGHVSFKDNGFKTCKKETYEEIGLALNDNEIKYVDTFDIKNCFVEIYYINKNVNINELKLQKSEVGNVYWMNEDEINDLINNNLFRESNIQPFKRVVEYIKNEYNVL